MKKYKTANNDLKRRNHENKSKMHIKIEYMIEMVTATPKRTDTCYCDLDKPLN